MSQDDAAKGDADEPFGRSVEAVAEAVRDTEAAGAGDAAADPESVRATLSAVSEDGDLTRATLDDALGHLAKVVSTPETRLEFTQRALAEARETAAPVADVGVVAERLDAFEAEVAALAERVADLSTRLSRIVEAAEAVEDAADLYAVAADVRALKADANQAGGDADRLAEEIERFEGWVADPSRRLDALAEDADAVDAALQELLAEADGLLDATGRRHAGVDEADRAEHAAVTEAAATDADVTGDHARTWATAALRRHVFGLLVEDLRAELDDLRTIAERRDVEGFDAEEVAERLDGLESFRRDIGHRLDDAFAPAWAEGYGEVVLAFDEWTREAEPPVDWAAVQEEMERHRERLPEAGEAGGTA
jgi:chromosome segregation ATPase